MRLRTVPYVYGPFWHLLWGACSSFMFIVLMSCLSFLYSGYDPFVSYMCNKYFVLWFLFILLMMSLMHMNSSFYYCPINLSFSYVINAFSGMFFKKSVFTPMSWKYCLSGRSFVVSPFTFISTSHLELSFMYGVR